MKTVWGKFRGLKMWQQITIGVFLAFAVLVAVTPSPEDSADGEADAETPAAATAAATATPVAETTESTVEATPAATQPAPDSNLTTPQRNAVRSAKSYLDFMGFSCQGLIEQLSSEYGGQYTVAQATYAATQVGLC